MSMPRIEEELSKIGQPYKLNKADYKIHVEGKGDIIFRSMERPERIVAYETADAVIDELDTLKPDKAEFVYRKITERTRAKKHDGKPNTVAVVTTPDNGISGFVYKLYGKPQQGYELIKASTYDNPFLPTEYIEQIKANYDETLAELYLNGEFVSLTHNKVYHYFNRVKHHSDRTIQPNDILHIGIDFNIGACCSVVYVREGDKLIAVDEFISYDTREIIINLKQRYTNRIMLYPDASGDNRSTNSSQSDIALLREAGYTINAPSTNGAVRDRVNSTNNLLSKDRMLVNTKKCPQFTFSLESQGYTDKGEPEKFNVHKDGAIDDWNDSGTYPIARIYPINRNTFTVSSYH